MAARTARAELVECNMIETARALDAAFEGAARAGDAARLVARCYADGGRLVPPSGPGVRGVDQIRACWRSIFDAGLADVALDTPDVISTGEVAYGIGRYTLVYRPAGGVAVRDAGRRVLAYRRQADGRWAVTADIWTSDGTQGEPAANVTRVPAARWRGCRLASHAAHEDCRRTRARGRRRMPSAPRSGVTP